MKSDTIYIQNEEEEWEEMSILNFRKHILSENEVPDMIDEDIEPGEDGHVMMEAAEVVEKIVALASKGKELPEDPMMDPYKDVYSFVEEAVKASKEYAADEKDRKAKEKEKAAQAKKEAKEKKEKALALFGDSAAEGVSRARDDFRNEVETLKDGLPDGVDVGFDPEEGITLHVDDEAGAETFGDALGYLMASEQNTEAKTGVIQYLIGLLFNESKRLKLYRSGRAAGEAISAAVLEKTGKRLAPRNVEQYGRMAERIPANLFNPAVDVTAYLALSNVKEVPMPKKSDFPTEKEYLSAKKEAEAKSKEHEANRVEVAEKLAAGEITYTVGEGDEEEEVTKDITKRKDALPLIDSFKDESGLYPKKDPDLKGKAELLLQFFYCTFAKEYFSGVFKKGTARFHTKESEAATVDFTDKQLQDMIEEAKNGLQQIFFGEDFTELLEGTVEKEQKIVKDGKVVKDDDGNPKTKTVKVKVHPKWILRD